MGQQPAAADSIIVNQDSITDLVRQIDRLPTEGIYVAVAIGLLLFIIGWFGGTKMTYNKVFTCVIIVTLVGIFSLPLATFLFKWLHPALGSTGAFSVVYILWSMYLLGMAISLYETLIVTAEEARP